MVLPAETRHVSLPQNIQNCSSAHPAPTQWVPQALTPGYSRGRIKLTTHLHLTPRAIHLLLLLAFVVWTTSPCTVTKLKIHSHCKTYPMQSYFLTKPHTAVHHTRSLFLFPSEARHCEFHKLCQMLNEAYKEGDEAVA